MELKAWWMLFFYTKYVLFGCLFHRGKVSSRISSNFKIYKLFIIFVVYFMWLMKIQKNSGQSATPLDLQDFALVYSSVCRFLCNHALICEFQLCPEFYSLLTIFVHLSYMFQFFFSFLISTISYFFKSELDQFGSGNFLSV